MIEINIQKHFANFSLDLSLKLKKGLTVLFGPSGAGKSLTLQTIAGWIEPDSGNIRVNGVDYYDKHKGINLPIHHRRIGYVFQEPSLFPHMTVFENIAYGITRLPAPERNKKAAHIIERMRLKGLEKRFPHQISGGQKQRTALTRALAASPLLLLLDEPFTSLDSPFREKLRLDLLNIRKEDNIPLLFVTHDVEETFVLADEVVVLHEGKVEQIGDKEDIFYRPQTLNVAKFFGVKNIFRGKVVEISPDKGEMQVWVDEKSFRASLPYQEGAKVGGWVRFCIRPEEIMVLKNGRPSHKNLKTNTFYGKIVQVIEKGSEHTVLFKQGRDTYDFEISLSNLAYRKLHLHEGQEVHVHLKWESIWIIPEKNECPRLLPKTGLSGAI